MHNFEIIIPARCQSSRLPGKPLKNTWNSDGKQGGLGHFTKIWEKNIENEYRKNLAKLHICDTLVGIIYK